MPNGREVNEASSGAGGVESDTEKQIKQAKRGCTHSGLVRTELARAFCERERESQRKHERHHGEREEKAWEASMHSTRKREERCETVEQDFLAAYQC
jgi:hypothetical protein